MSTEDETLDLLAYHAFPKLANALNTRREVIIAHWENAVRRTLPAADNLTLSQLRNSLPDILREMVDALASEGPAATRELIEGSKAHGETRFHNNYNVRELVIEYRLLRRIIIEQVTEEIGERLDHRQNVALNMAIDTALQAGMIRFTDSQAAAIRAATESQAKHLSFLSHDLRGQLGYATLTLELLAQRMAKSAESIDSVQLVRSLQRAIFQTTEGMERILQAEQFRNQSIKPVFETFPLHPLLTEIGARQQLQASLKNILIQVSVPIDAIVQSDRNLISLVLQNIIGNAIKYSTHGSVVLTAERMSGIESSGWQISVSDQGPGISPENVETLFEAFRRGDTHGQPGVGLGLAIASQAARLLGAELRIDSTLGGGSTFKLILPDQPKSAT